MRIQTTGIYILCVLLLSACSNTKHLPNGETLFVGSKVNIVDNVASKKERKILKEDLAASVRPKPNTKFFGARLKLRLYNFAGIPKKNKGLKAWLRNKVGEPPVLISSVDQENNKAIMTNLLQNRGFFFATITSKPETNHKKTTVVFNVTTKAHYYINDVLYDKDSSRVSQAINATKNKTLLKKGTAYNLELIKGERSRIETVLRRKGFFYFMADDILVKADTSIGSHKVDLQVTLKGEKMKQEEYTVYTINNIYVYPSYKLRGKASDTTHQNATEYKGIYIVDMKKRYKPSLFSENLMFKSGQVYNSYYQNNSLSRLVNLGIFKFVKNRFEVSGLSDTMLDVYYYLTPYPKYALRFQIGALTQNDSRAGSQASISWTDRNAFKGGEIFQLKVNGGFEAQYSGVVQRPNIYNIGTEADLAFPGFVVPFFHVSSSSAFTPKTIIKAGYNYESQSDLLRINSYKISYGYDWKENARKEHQFYPFNFTYVKTDTLGNAAALGILYGNLVFNGIIIGPTYEFTYSSQGGKNEKIDNYFFDGLIDLSGNILGIAERADYKTNPQTLLGSSYAQYLKLQPDFRYYHKFAENSSLASRILIGAGIPYGNSSQLPNIKQFYSGGNSSLRGFPSRLVGPGTFNEQYLDGTDKYIQTLGDIKLELSTEYRAHLYKFINTAIFVDAGNIWLFNDNPDFPGGKFTNDFYKELAVDIGIGLRFDFKVFLLRLDLGMPVREPWLPINERWVFNAIDFGDPAWRKQNLIFNLAIGYPF